MNMSLSLVDRGVRSIEGTFTSGSLIGAINEPVHCWGGNLEISGHILYRQAHDNLSLNTEELSTWMLYRCMRVRDVVFHRDLI